MCRVQGLSFPPGKGLALVALWTQTVENQPNRCATLLHRRFTSVQNDRGPPAAGTQRNSLYDGTLVRRGLIVKHLSLVPALARGSRCDQLKRPLGLWFVSCPAGSDRGTSVSCLRVDNGDVRVGLGRLQDDQIFSGHDRPTGRNRESGSARRYVRCISCQSLRCWPCFCRLRWYWEMGGRRCCLRKGGECQENYQSGSILGHAESPYLLKMREVAGATIHAVSPACKTLQEDDRELLQRECCRILILLVKNHHYTN